MGPGQLFPAPIRTMSLEVGKTQGVEGSLQNCAAVQTIISPGEKEGREGEESFINCLLVSVMEGGGRGGWWGRQLSYILPFRIFKQEH